jgi:serine/threonine-protein kinase RsbW
MSRSSPAVCEMRVVLPAALHAVEEFLAEFRRRSQQMVGRVDCFAAELLVREALNNAVLHGCHANPEMKVRCSLRLKGNRLLIAVEDEGDGFDWRAARVKRAAAHAGSGRGMEILQRYANHVRFNQKGNGVTMIKQLKEGEQA